MQQTMLALLQANDLGLFSALESILDTSLCLSFNTQTFSSSFGIVTLNAPIDAVLLHQNTACDVR